MVSNWSLARLGRLFRITKSSGTSSKVWKLKRFACSCLRFFPHPFDLFFFPHSFSLCICDDDKVNRNLKMTFSKWKSDTILKLQWNKNIQLIVHVTLFINLSLNFIVYFPCVLISTSIFMNIIFRDEWNKTQPHTISAVFEICVS